METTQTVSALHVARERIAFDAHLVDIIAQQYLILGDVDDFNLFSVGLWTYDEPSDIQALSDGARRAEALNWLRRHTTLIRRVARHMGETRPVEKFANDHYFGARVAVYSVGAHASGCVSRLLTAQVPSALTCEMVPTGEVHHIPAHDVPVMERHCPESIFAGIEQEVSV